MAVCSQRRRPSGCRDRGQPEGAPDGPSHIKRVLIIWAVLSVVFVAWRSSIVPLDRAQAGELRRGLREPDRPRLHRRSRFPSPCSSGCSCSTACSRSARRRRTTTTRTSRTSRTARRCRRSPRYQIAWLLVTTALAFFTVGVGHVRLLQGDELQARQPARGQRRSGRSGPGRTPTPSSACRATSSSSRSAGPSSSASHPTTSCTGSASPHSASRWTPTRASGSRHPWSHPTSSATSKSAASSSAASTTPTCGRRSRWSPQPTFAAWVKANGGNYGVLTQPRGRDPEGATSRRRSGRSHLMSISRSSTPQRTAPRRPARSRGRFIPSILSGLVAGPRRGDRRGRRSCTASSAANARPTTRSSAPTSRGSSSS